MDDNAAGTDERESLRRYYEALTPEERRARILLVPAYRDSYNELIHAHRTVEQPAYFWERWVPVLGPIAAVLYMKLRQYCFYRQGPADDVCWPRQDTLAREIGIRSAESLRAALQVLEREGFIERQRSCRVDPRSGRPIRGTDRYVVFFEIPLRAEDAAELLIRSVHQIPMTLDSANAVKPPLGANGPMAEKPLLGDLEGSPNAGIPLLGDANAVKPRYGAGGNTALATPANAVKPRAEVNVQRFQRSTLSSTDSRFSETSPAQELANQIAEELDDPDSLKWFRLIADKLPEGRIRIVLSETRAARDEGRLRGSAGAYFTGGVRRVAVELGIAL